jgi:hypothetical protein
MAICQKSFSRLTQDSDPSSVVSVLVTVPPIIQPHTQEETPDAHWELVDCLIAGLIARAAT